MALQLTRAPPGRSRPWKARPSRRQLDESVTAKNNARHFRGVGNFATDVRSQEFDKAHNSTSADLLSLVFPIASVSMSMFVALALRDLPGCNYIQQRTSDSALRQLN